MLIITTRSSVYVSFNTVYIRPINLLVPSRLSAVPGAEPPTSEKKLGLPPVEECLLCISQHLPERKREPVSKTWKHDSNCELVATSSRMLCFQTRHQPTGDRVFVLPLLRQYTHRLKSYKSELAPAQLIQIVLNLWKRSLSTVENCSDRKTHSCFLSIILSTSKFSLYTFYRL